VLVRKQVVDSDSYMAALPIKTNMTILLLGKTGIGKSTTGNKMLGIYDSDDKKQGYMISECRQGRSQPQTDARAHTFNFKL